jgi:23S rRNA pseudouridine1911/1915/1917 synthase
MKKLTEQHIIYEDNHLLIVNKPAGLLVQGDVTGDVTLLDLAKAYVKEKYDKPGDVFMGLPHRLDRVTSGLVILARTSKALSRMSEIFRNREIEKVYWMVTDKYPEPAAGDLVHYLLKDPEKNKVTARLHETPGWQKAELSYSLKASTGPEHLLEAVIHTGRPHQIRAQMSAVGLPVYGDLKYGSKHSMQNNCIALHSRKLSFTHPVQKVPMEFVGKIPGINPWGEFRQWDVR